MQTFQASVSHWTFLHGHTSVVAVSPKQIPQYISLLMQYETVDTSAVMSEKHNLVLNYNVCNFTAQ